MAKKLKAGDRAKFVTLEVGIRHLSGQVVTLLRPAPSFAPGAWVVRTESGATLNAASSELIPEA